MLPMPAITGMSEKNQTLLQEASGVYGGLWSVTAPQNRLLSWENSMMESLPGFSSTRSP